MLKELGAKGVTRLLVEGGGDVLGQLHDLQLIDELWCFVTPLLTGGNKPSFGGAGVERMGDASRLHRIRYKRIGNDVLVTGQMLRADVHSSDLSRRNGQEGAILRCGTDSDARAAGGTGRSDTGDSSTDDDDVRNRQRRRVIHGAGGPKCGPAFESEIDANKQKNHQQQKGVPYHKSSS